MKVKMRKMKLNLPKGISILKMKILKIFKKSLTMMMMMIFSLCQIINYQDFRLSICALSLNLIIINMFYDNLICLLLVKFNCYAFFYNFLRFVSKSAHLALRVALMSQEALCASVRISHLITLIVPQHGHL